jgi:hypothetical protein
MGYRRVTLSKLCAFAHRSSLGALRTGDGNVSGQRLIVWRVLLIGLFVGPFAVAPASALDPTRSIVQMSHRAYTRDDGLPGGVSSIAQTKDGYLWIGTANGLYRFDGVRFEPFAADKLLAPASQG